MANYKFEMKEKLKLLPAPFCQTEDLIIDCLQKNTNILCLDALLLKYSRQAKAREYETNPDYLHNFHILSVEIMQRKEFYRFQNPELGVLPSIPTNAKNTTSEVASPTCNFL